MISLRWPSRDMVLSNHLNEFGIHRYQQWYRPPLLATE
jgi:hypothetical protein